MKFPDLESIPFVSKVARGKQIDTFVLIYDQSELVEGPLRFKQILSTIRANVRNFPKYQQLYQPNMLSKDGHNWQLDESFDTEFHVRHIALPKPGDWRQFCIQVARLHARPLDQTRPLWEINVIEGLDNISKSSQGYFALVCKVHHALMETNANSNFALLWGMHDQYEPLVNSVANEEGNLFSFVGDIFKFSTNKLLAPANHTVQFTVDNLYNVSRSLTPMIRFFTSGLFGQRKVAYTRFNTNISNFRVWETCSISLADFETIKAAFPDTTDEQIVITIVGDALKKYLSNLNELGSAELCTFIIDTEEQPDGVDVNVGVLNLESYISDPVERLTHLANGDIYRESIKQLKISSSLASPLQRLSLCNALLHDIQSQIAGNPLANTTLVFLPEYNEKVSLIGAPLKYYSCIPEIIDGLGLIHTSTIIDGQIHIAFTSCREMMPDPGIYRDNLADSAQFIFNRAKQVLEE